jgi:hypothetical protein
LKGLVFFLNVSAAATEVGDLLDVWIQESPDQGSTTWNDVLRFTQVLGNGGAKKYLAIVNCEGPVECELAAVQDAVMAAGVRQGLVIPYIRSKWTVTDAGADNASFTFSLSVIAIR